MALLNLCLKESEMLLPNRFPNLDRSTKARFHTPDCMEKYIYIGPVYPLRVSKIHAQILRESKTAILKRHPAALHNASQMWSMMNVNQPQHQVLSPEKREQVFLVELEDFGNVSLEARGLLNGFRCPVGIVLHVLQHDQTHAHSKTQRISPDDLQRPWAEATADQKLSLIHI